MSVITPFFKGNAPVQASVPASAQTSTQASARTKHRIKSPDVPKHVANNSLRHDYIRFHRTETRNHVHEASLRLSWSFRDQCFADGYLVHCFICHKRKITRVSCRCHRHLLPPSRQDPHHGFTLRRGTACQHYASVGAVGLNGW